MEGAVALVVVPELMQSDLSAWEAWAKQDARLAHTRRMRTMEARSLRALERFVVAGGGYLGVSWGKDSVCAAHLIWQIERQGGPRLPVVWIVARPVVSPHSVLVRDAFLERFPLDYHEVLDDRVYDPSAEDARWTGWAGDWRGGFRKAEQLLGRRHISGVRAAESGTRTLAMRRFGEVSANTCRPMGWWSGADVFAYLAKYDLPIHPAYAMTFGGLLERERIRVDALGGDSGTGFGRREWEERYHRDALHQIVHTIRDPAECPWWTPYGLFGSET